MFYIVQYQYSPNSAWGNRLLGYVETLEEQQLETTVVFFAPDAHYSKIESTYNYIHFKYYWNKAIPIRGFIRSFALKKALSTFTSSLKAGDIVYTIGLNRITKTIRDRKDIVVYAEKTEHPDAAPEMPLLALSSEHTYDTTMQLDGLFVISQALLNYYVSYGYPKAKITIVNMTVDPSRFTGLKKSEQKTRYIAYCGTASNNKDGVDELIKAFALVKKRIKDVKLYIIGATPTSEDRSANILLIKQLGLADDICFKGIVPYKEMPQILINAEVLALDRPDNLQARYGFPTKLGEYLLTGNPVVVTKVGDIPMFLSDMNSALIAEEKDPEAFAEKIIWAIEHHDAAQIIGQRGKDIAIKNFNSKTETLKIINKIRTRL